MEDLTFLVPDTYIEDTEVVTWTVFDALSIVKQPE